MLDKGFWDCSSGKIRVIFVKATKVDEKQKRGNTDANLRGSIAILTETLCCAAAPNIWLPELDRSFAPQQSSVLLKEVIFPFFAAAPDSHDQVGQGPSPGSGR